MAEKVDLRIQRTYKLLTDALMEMLSEEDFDQITVRGLCQRAMIRPATFYMHFGDKYEFFTFVIRSLMHRFREENTVTYDTMNPYPFHLGMMDQMFQFIENSKTLVVHVFKGGSSHILLDLIYDSAYYEVLEEMKEETRRGTKLKGQPELVATIYTGAMIYTIKWWVERDFRPERRVIVEDLYRILGVRTESEEPFDTGSAVRVGEGG